MVHIFWKNRQFSIVLSGGGIVEIVYHIRREISFFKYSASISTNMEKVATEIITNS